jgi:deoxyribodipyrimidine photo-lyase
VCVSSPTLVWFRDDLRIGDNPALSWAIDRGGPVLALYLLDEDSPEIRPLGSASKWWLHHSLLSLASSLSSIGVSLVLRRGAAREVVPQLMSEIGAGAVAWNRRYGASRVIDQELKTSLRDKGLDVQSFQASVLFEPWTIHNKDGNPFQVFTPFWKTALAGEPPREPLTNPSATTTVESVASDGLNEWGLLPTEPDWSGGLSETWTPGEAGAQKRLDDFLEKGLELYHRRDEPGIVATSMLSPHLRFGEISPFQVWHQTMLAAGPELEKNRDKFLSEVGWREFMINVLYQHPTLHTENIKKNFDLFPWGSPAPEELKAWQKGKTGIPLVDAGMRELWHTGYMHNRVRMVTASFLIKNMLIDWRVGEQWFWDTLVDADEANNPGSWQWVAGCGTDAAPYFRVFNPVVQAEKFDLDGVYRSRWLPEWNTPDYPDAIVDLAETRERALSAFEAIKAVPRSG